MTDEEIVIAWRKVLNDQGKDPIVLRFARAIMKIERERCAQICEDLMERGKANAALNMAIRRIDPNLNVQNNGAND